MKINILDNCQQAFEDFQSQNVYDQSYLFLIISRNIFIIDI